MQRGCSCSSASLFALVLLLTQSRGAWLALAAGLVALVLVHPARARVLRGRLLGVSLAALVTIVAVAASVGLANSSGDALGDRPEYWDTALDDARDDPFSGSGAGSFEEYWAEHGIPGVFVRDAHSLYLETLAELGVVGLLLLLALIAAPLLALAEGRVGPVEAAAAGGFDAFLVHAGIDWDWEMPAVTLTGLGGARSHCSLPPGTGDRS